MARTILVIIITWSSKGLHSATLQEFKQSRRQEVNDKQSHLVITISSELTTHALSVGFCSQKISLCLSITMHSFEEREDLILHLSLNELLLYRLSNNVISENLYLKIKRKLTKNYFNFFYCGLYILS